MPTKPCRTCGDVFEASGPALHCVSCREEAARARRKAWRERHPDRDREAKARYAETNRERLREKARLTRSANIAAALAREAANRERRRQARAPKVKPCARCGTEIAARGRTTYCDDCRPIHHRESSRESAARERTAAAERARLRQARYRERHREDLRERERQRRATPEHRAYMSRDLSKRFFGGLREAVLERDGYRCTKCGVPWEDRSRRITVHHRDRDPSHNTMENLVTLCRRCHATEHREDLARAKQTA